MILDQLLRKLGVESYTDLNDEERATFKEWEQALNGRKITDDDVAIFLQTELETSLQKLISQPLKEREDIFLKMEVNFIRKLQKFLDAPRVEKELLEQQIKNQI